jgi:hypothetical protein
MGKFNMGRKLTIAVTSFMGFFAGSVAVQLQTMLDSDHFDFSNKSVKHMLVTGIITSGISLYHLYQNLPEKKTQDNQPPANQ